MGKNLIQQARGKGGPRYRAPSFRYKGEGKYANFNANTLVGRIIEFIDSQGHNAPLAQIKYENGTMALIQAPEGVKAGDVVKMGEKVEIKTGNVTPLKNIPEGVSIYNIESRIFSRGWRKICKVLRRL